MNICEPKHDRTILQALFQLITGKNVPLPGHHLNSSNNKLYLHLNEFIRLYIPIHSTQHSLGSQTIAKYFGIHPNMDYPPLNPPTRGYDLCERTGLPTSTSHPQHVLTSQNTVRSGPLLDGCVPAWFMHNTYQGNKLHNKYTMLIAYLHA